MRITEATIYGLNIPFVESFNHSTQARHASDSIVVRLVSEDGVTGYGEGVARSYVTGETIETSLARITNRLLPAVLKKDFAELVPGPDPLAALAPIDEALPDEAKSNGVIAWHAARCAVETALIDCLLKRQKLSLAHLLPPAREFVTYSGVITEGSLEKSVQHAKFFKLFDVRQLKIKIGAAGARERVAAVREVVGPNVSLRLDANGAYDVPQAIHMLRELAAFDIASIEQPIRRGSLTDLAEVKNNSPIPLMVDESLVTLADGSALIEAAACDYFNLRLSKCGGIARTLRLARLAERAGLKVQLGSHVGETAILSAAGRHVAAHLCDPAFVEGSYGQMLLAEDVSQDSIGFGHGGRAPLLRGMGLGVKIREEVLCRFAHTVIYQR
ncbi:MAG TPA: enolase C-terminal domain-like protein [Pyrinomonadaceae bacterium]|nr:enolase C-terminal domain-like protein [Pyrinomonadaceae bacterium]